MEHLELTNHSSQILQVLFRVREKEFLVAGPPGRDPLAPVKQPQFQAALVRDPEPVRALDVVGVPRVRVPEHVGVVDIAGLVARRHLEVDLHSKIVRK